MADGIGMDLDQRAVFEDTTALVDVFEDREDLVLGRVGDGTAGYPCVRRTGPRQVRQ